MWSTAALCGIGLLIAYFIGVSPNGFLVWPRAYTFGADPPADVPLRISIDSHEGLIYFKQLDEMNATALPEGWYELPNHNEPARPDWLSESTSVIVPSKIHRPQNPHLGDAEIVLLDTRSHESTNSVERVELEYMFYHGQKYRVLQEYKDGFVRPLRVWVIPDSMPMLMGMIIIVGMWLFLSVVSMIICGWVGYKLSQKYN